MSLKLRLQSSRKKCGTLPITARASLWYAICGILQKGIGVIVVPLYTRIMDPTAYGTYMVFQSCFSLLFVFTSLGLANYVFNNGMVRYESERDAFTSAMLGLSLVVSIAFMISFLIFPSFWVNLLGLSAPVAFLLFIRALISPCYELWSARLRYEFRYKGVVALTLVLTFAVPLVSIPVIILSDDKAAAALVCQVLVMSIVYLVPLISIVRKSRRLFDGRFWIYALKFNLPLLPSIFATLALQQLNRVVIAGTVGEAQAAIFSVAFSVGSIALFVYSALEQAYRPWFYQHMVKSKDFNATGVAALVVATVSVFCGLITLFAPEIMMLFAPADYWSGIYAVAPIAASNILIMLFSVYITVEYYYEDTLPIPFVSIAAAIVNFFLSLLLVPMFGFLAAGYVTVFCYLLLVVGHAFLCKRTARLHLNGKSPVSIVKLLVFALALVAIILSLQLIYEWLIVRLVILVLLICFLVVRRKKLIGSFRTFIKKRESNGTESGI